MDIKPTFTFQIRCSERDNITASFQNSLSRTRQQSDMLSRRIHPLRTGKPSCSQTPMTHALPPCPHPECDCPYHTDAMRIVFHDGSAWCVECVHPIRFLGQSFPPKSGGYNTSRNPILRSQSTRPNVAERVRSDCPSESKHGPNDFSNTVRNSDVREEDVRDGIPVRIPEPWGKPIAYPICDEPKGDGIHGGKDDRPENKDGNGSSSDGGSLAHGDAERSASERPDERTYAPTHERTSGTSVAPPEAHR